MCAKDADAADAKFGGAQVRYDVYATKMATATLPGPRTAEEASSWRLMASPFGRGPAERMAAALVGKDGWKGARVFESKDAGAMVYESGTEGP